MRRVLRVGGGLLLGLIGGLVISLAIVVARAHLQSVYVHSIGDIVGWLGLPVILGPAVGVWLGVVSGRRLAGAAVGFLMGLLVGIGAGVAVGAVLGEGGTPRWAGGVIGGALGLTIGAVAGAVMRDGAAERVRSAGEERVVATDILAALLLAAVSCADEEPRLPPASQLPEPDPDRVESVILFVGDIGKSRELYHPIVPRMQREVERWARQLERDSAVVVVILGDLLYPEGLHPEGHELWQRDSLRLAAQLQLVSGPVALERGARAYFVPGNHDWGRQKDWEGAVRVKRVESFIESWRGDTVSAYLEPKAGTGGPAVVDIGEHVRLLLLDTAWWLLEGERQDKDAVIEKVEGAMRSAGDRHVMFGAHHPFESAGPHGGYRSITQGFVIGYLLARSGALLQDLNSQPYQDLRWDLLNIFAKTRPPILFAGGHEHSLQVVRTERPTDPEIHLVSGSATKLTGVGHIPGLLFARSAPGYARLFVMRDGSLELFIEAAPPRFLECPEGDPQRSRCMEEGVAAYGTVWAGEL